MGHLGGPGGSGLFDLGQILLVSQYSMILVTRATHSKVERKATTSISNVVLIQQRKQGFMVFSQFFFFTLNIFQE